MQEYRQEIKTKNVLLTDRDLQLLRMLYDHPALSLEHVRQNIFCGKSWPTVLNRLKKLEEGGFIKRLSVGRFKADLTQKNVSVLVKITQAGLRKLARGYLNETFFENIMDIKQSQLEHDLLLVDVIEKLKKEYPRNKFMSGRVFLKDKNKTERVPDFVMIEPLNNRTTAIELELTGKSEKRYRQIVLSYRLSKIFDQVLFITALDSIKSKICESVLGRKVNKSENMEYGKFTYLSLKDLLS